MGIVLWLRLHCAQLQNPVISQMWISATFQLLGPIVSLTVDTRQFVMPIFRTKPLMTLAATFTILATVAILVPIGQDNAFALYQFPQPYRFRLQGLGVAAIVYYYLVVTLVRRGLVWYEQRRIRPA